MSNKNKAFNRSDAETYRDGTIYNHSIEIKEIKIMTNEYIKMNNEELTQTVGGRDGKVGLWEGPKRTVHGLESGWLALRSDPCYDYHNEIGQLYNGDEVQIMGNDAMTEHDFDKTQYTGYTWVYSKRLDKSGWVNSRFI
jgi:hypothetical protein